MKKEIDKTEVLQAQKEWADGIVDIGKAYRSNQDYEARAARHIDELYAYQQSKVLFKPTKAAKKAFRPSPEAALSYFVGTNGWADEDQGFAITPWKKVRFENSDIVCNSDNALAMGNYYFTDENENEVRVEYSFGYVRGEDGKVRINLHHSSLPFVNSDS